jgi:hypothetical protein
LQILARRFLAGDAVVNEDQVIGVVEQVEAARSHTSASVTRLTIMCSRGKGGAFQNAEKNGRFDPQTPFGSLEW